MIQEPSTNTSSSKAAADASTREDIVSQLDLSAVIIHYQTPDLLKIAVESFKRFYPQTPLYVVDNGSDSDVVDSSRRLD
jgi:hypothetical protein